MLANTGIDSNKDMSDVVFVLLMSSYRREYDEYNIESQFKYVYKLTLLS